MCKRGAGGGKGAAAGSSTSGRVSPGTVGYDPYNGGKCTALDAFPQLHYFSNNLFGVFNKYVSERLVAGERGRTGNDLDYRKNTMPMTEFR